MDVYVSDQFRTHLFQLVHIPSSLRLKFYLGRNNLPYVIQDNLSVADWSERLLVVV